MTVENIRHIPWTPADDLLAAPLGKRVTSWTELDDVYALAFPRMPPEERAIVVGDFFIPAKPGRQWFTGRLRDKEGRLAAAAVFLLAEVNYGGAVSTAAYLLSRAVRPEHQGAGLGKAIAARILEEFQPELLLSTCGQSAALHSWIRLGDPETGGAYESFPRLAPDGRLLSPPDERLGQVVAAFRQMFTDLLPDGDDQITGVLSRLSVLMVRKELFRERYDRDPWRWKDRPDALAAALDLRAGDGVLVALLKRDARKDRP